jgi:hypothetical protein
MIMNGPIEFNSMNSPNYPEMEFSLKKDSSLLLHAIHSLFYWRILKKTILHFGFHNPYKKIRETTKLESIHK